ncbi:MAG: hypothetical protein AAF236_03165 [Verrucomicrobiota bacterium]
MIASLKELAPDPFAEDCVVEPRKSEAAVPDLNQEALEKLIAAFQQVSPSQAGKLPIQFITSESPGFGKSHLIGRLFRTIGEDATRVYLQPFVDPSNSWSSILMTIVQELTMGESPDEVYPPEGEPDQLDSLASGILVNLLASCFELGHISHDAPKQVAGQLRRGELDCMTRQSGWGKWFDAEIDALIPILARQLDREARLSGETTAEAYLRVLLAYIRDRSDYSTRQLCLEWLKVKSLEPDEAASLALPRRAIVDEDATREEIKALSRARVFDLCAIACRHRPFLLCFDQTEIFARDPRLVTEFGTLLSELFQNAPNQLTVITSNQAIWQQKIRPGFDEAHLDRIAAPIELAGLTRDQACDLAALRLGTIGFLQSEIASFLDPDWLETVFVTREIPAREFISACSARYAQLRSDDSSPLLPSLPSEAELAPEPSLADYFEKETNRVAQQTRRLVFNRDILQWLFLEVAGASPDPPFAVGAARQQSRNDYFPVLWRDSSGASLHSFNFEEGNHHRRWAAIFREATRSSSSTEPVRCHSIRTAELPIVPRPNWKVARPDYDEALSHGFRIHSISGEMLVGIYAGWELYSRACQNDIPVSPDDVILYLRAKLVQWWGTLLRQSIQDLSEEDGRKKKAYSIKPSARSASPLKARPKSRRPLRASKTESAQSPEMVKAVEDIVSEIRFISETELSEKFAEATTRSLEKSALIELCESSAKLQLHPHPKNFVVQWVG